MPAPRPTCACGDCRLCRDRARKAARRRDDPGAVKAIRDRWREANRSAVSGLQREYARTPEGRRAEAARQRRDRVKVRARNAVANALRRGRLVRGRCVREGPDCRGRIEAHHGDYSAPLDVVWACAHHHGELDAELAEREAVEAAAA